MDPCDKWPCYTLPTLDNNPYRSIAFDGCFYYLTIPRDTSIYKFDSNFSPKGEIEGSRSYSGLCYDSLEKCFWATEVTRHNMIFKLNRKMQEIDCITFENSRCDHRQMLGISFDCAKDVLVVALKDAIYEVSKTGDADLLISDLCTHVLNVASIAPYLAVMIKDGDKQCILYYRGGRLVETERVPLEFRIRDMIYNPCKSTLMILTTKHCRYPQILCYPLDFDADPCHKALCHSKPEPPDDRCSIITSVAMMEAALSHILNAEGEKLQKAVEIADSVGELLEVNESIHKTLMHAIKLEHILYAKLQAAIELEC